MATYTRTYTITTGLGSLGGKTREFSLEGITPTGSSVPIKKITGIKVIRYHAVNLTYTWYLKAVFSKKYESGNFCAISSDKQSINSTFWTEKPAYFKDGSRTYIKSDGSTSSMKCLPTVEEWNTITSEGSLVLLASKLGHDYLGYAGESSEDDYYLLTKVGPDNPIIITVTYEGEEQQDFTIESLSATRTNNTGSFNVFLKINYSEDYVFTSSDIMTAYLSKNSDLSNPIYFNFSSNEWEAYKLGSSFGWSGASDSNTTYYVGIRAIVNGKTVTKIVALSQLPSSTIEREGVTNLHLSGSGKGVGIGGLSKGTTSTPYFDCYYPSKFYKDVEIDGDLTVKGVSVKIPKILYGTIGNFTVSNQTGSITINFGESFESIPVVTATLYRSAADGAARQPSYVITEITNSSFTLHCYQAGAYNTTYTVHWIAIGT